MKSRVNSANRHTMTAVMTIAVTMLVASLLTSVAVSNADAANGSGVKAPAPRAAALTAQEQIGRNQGVRPAESPQKMSLDRLCKGPRIPKKCHPHRH